MPGTPRFRARIVLEVEYEPDPADYDGAGGDIDAMFAIDERTLSSYPEAWIDRMPVVDSTLEMVST